MTSQQRYMCYVEGTHAPWVVHYSYEVAMQEAERLARQAQNANKAVYVVQVRARLEQAVTPVTVTEY